jgi:hypothetical protein
MFLGMATYSIRSGKGKYYNSRWEDAFYFQDNIRVTSRLKLHLGVRWQITPFISEKNNVMSTFDPQRRAIVFGTDMDTMLRLGSIIPSVRDRFQQLGVKFMTYQEAGLPRKLGYNNCRGLQRWEPHEGAPPSGVCRSRPFRLASTGISFSDPRHTARSP